VAVLKNVEVDMPRVDDKVLDCVFYLYPDASAAAAGEEFGGSGFLVYLPSSTDETREFVYAITNWHVAVRHAFSVIRLNTLHGGIDILEYGPEDWSWHPNGHDVAALLLSGSVLLKHKATYIHRNMILDEEVALRDAYGVGDDVFMIGRFIDHDGVATNQPAARFGNISVMPFPIEQPTGIHGDSYCIDLHSRTGFSGSPVFVYRTPGYDLRERDTEGKILGAGFSVKLLGIHWGQFPELWQIEAAQNRAGSEQNEPLILNGKYVKGLSGMSCVIPSSRILELLNIDKFIRERAECEQAVERS